MRYIWAAYKRGILKPIVQHVPAGLEVADFKKALLAFVGWVLERGGEVYVPLVRKGDAMIPGGLVAAHINPPYFEPHCIWFPEANARERLELTLRFLIDMKARFKVTIWAPDPDWKLFHHVCKYGVLRAVGKYRGFFPDGRDAMLFQGVN